MKKAACPSRKTKRSTTARKAVARATPQSASAREPASKGSRSTTTHRSPAASSGSPPDLRTNLECRFASGSHPGCKQRLWILRIFAPRAQAAHPAQLGLRRDRIAGPTGLFLLLGSGAGYRPFASPTIKGNEEGTHGQKNDESKKE